MSEVNVNEFLRDHNARVENGRLILTIRCDSTYFFLFRMQRFLNAIGCTDIQSHGEQEDESIYGYRYTASGKMPDWMAKEMMQHEIH